MSYKRNSPSSMAEHIGNVAKARLLERGNEMIIDGVDALANTAYRKAQGAIKSLSAGYGSRKSSRGGAIEVRHSRKSIKSEAKVKMGTCPAPPKSSQVLQRDTFSTERPMLDSHLIPSLEENRLAPIVMRFGKQLYVDPVPNFLKHLSQSGSVSCSWSGVISSSLDKRAMFTNNFRHRISSQIEYSATGGDAFPTPAVMLTPEAPTNILVGAGALVTSSYHVHIDKSNYWVPINRADYEDMSWNLNKLKLSHNSTDFNQVSGGGQTVGGISLTSATPNAPMFLNNVAVQLENKHQRISALQNNNALRSVSTPGAPDQMSEASYKYNMVYKRGLVSYDFTNKLSQGSRVEVIVYRTRKGRQMSSQGSDYTAASTNASANPILNISSPIQQAYLDKARGKLGTEYLGGREPLATDVTENPDYPLLPVLSNAQVVKTPSTDPTTNAPFVQGFNEQSRISFALPAGARRKFDIVLEGIAYDPQNVQIPGAQTNDSLHPCMDHLGYTVLIAVNGVKMSRQYYQPTQFKPGPDIPQQEPILFQENSSEILGDIHAEAQLQYHCTYTETIQGCTYKKPERVILKNHAVAIDQAPNAEALEIMSACTILPIQNTVRLAAQENIKSEYHGHNGSYSASVENTNAGPRDGSTVS